MKMDRAALRRAAMVAAAIVILGALVVSAVGVSQRTLDASTARTEGEPEPGHAEPIPGSGTSLVKLTEEAARHLGIQTAPVQAIVDANGQARLVVPYGALFYDPGGQTWVYAQNAPLVFARQRVTVESIRAGDVVLTDGPAAGTPVVTVGTAELYGTEVGVGEE
jgi:hypothetical protein